MARLELAPEVFDDLDRFFDRMLQVEVEVGSERIGEILEAVDILKHSPLVGRPVKGGMRELIIGRSSRSYVALYRFVPAIDTVFVLAVRSQPESGYKREP